MLPAKFPQKLLQHCRQHWQHLQWLGHGTACDGLGLKLFAFKLSLRQRPTNRSWLRLCGVSKFKHRNCNICHSERPSTVERKINAASVGRSWPTQRRLNSNANSFSKVFLRHVAAGGTRYGDQTGPERLASP
jgi:hypothetical protein